MMRRSKRQNKSNTDSTDHPEQLNQQPTSLQESKVIQKMKDIQQKQQQDDKGVLQQSNFQSTQAKRELDSVVSNLASQLEKASNAKEVADNCRPKRVRKITEKAEQELLAKQSKVKTHKKKHNEQSQSSTDSVLESTKSIPSAVGIIQSKKTGSRNSSRTRKSESSIMAGQQDANNMDIENLQIYDKNEDNSSDDDDEKQEDSHNEAEEDNEDQDDNENSELDQNDNQEADENDEDDQSQKDEENSQQNEKQVDIQVEKNQSDRDDEKTNKVECEQELQVNQNILNIKPTNQKENIKISKKKCTSLVSSEDTKTNNIQAPQNIESDGNKPIEVATKIDIEQEQSIEQQTIGETILPLIPLQKKKSKATTLKKQNQIEKENQLNNKEGSEDEKTLEKVDLEEDEEINDNDDEEEDDDDGEMKDENDEGLLGDGSNSSKAKKMPWSDEEDKLVIRLVEQHGPQKWTFIAQHIPGRIGKQCRERWHNHLNPKINKEPWGDDEEWILFLCHRYKGNKWAEITQYLPGRTDNAIKNHWNSSMKKRIPELYHRFTLIKQGEILEYDITAQYKKFEDEILKSLLAMSDEGVEYFTQTTRRRRNNNNILTVSTPTNNASLPLPSLKTTKSKKCQEVAVEDKSIEEEQEKQTVPPPPPALTKKLSKAAIKAAAKQATLAQQTSSNEAYNEGTGASILNNHFTPNNNKSSSHHSNAFKTFPNSAAASTADVKEIIQRIPHNMKEFENFRKQIILYSDEYYQQQQCMLQQTPNDRETSLNILSADKCIVTDINLSDTKHLEKMLETPLSVENYVQQNPAFADIVRSALKYSSCQKNLTFMSHIKTSYSQNINCDNAVSTDHKLLSATSTLLSTIQQDKSSLNNLDQSNDDDLISQANHAEKMKKKRGRKPKALKEQETQQNNQVVSSSSLVNNANGSSHLGNNGNGMTKMIHEHPYMHPMYMMNPHHTHPYYANHPHRPSYLPPPPHMMRHGQQIPHMQGYHYSHHMQHPMPPHPMQHPHFMRGGQMGHHLPPPLPPHPSQMRGGQGGQGHMMMPPPPPHHLQQMRMRHPHGIPHPHSVYMGNSHNNGSNNNMMSQHSDSSENSNFQTPQKYQKNNLGDRSLFKSITPIIPQNSEKYEDKNNKIKVNNFANDDEYNNFLANNSFSKENINPNIQHLSLPSGKEPLIPTSINNNSNINLLQNQQISNNNATNNNSQTSNNQTSISGNGQTQNHNISFITPNKYETPSKLLDFDSEPPINCNSVDKYFNMRAYSSNHKSNNLYTNHASTFQRSSNSAFKCYPNISMDYQDTPSAKKQAYC